MRRILNQLKEMIDGTSKGDWIYIAIVVGVTAAAIPTLGYFRNKNDDQREAAYEQTISDINRRTELVMMISAQRVKLRSTTQAGETAAALHDLERMEEELGEIKSREAE